MNPCTTCTYVEEQITNEFEQKVYVCRRLPPTVCVIPARHAITAKAVLQTITSYPIITNDLRGCGEHLRSRTLMAAEGDEDDGT